MKIEIMSLSVLRRLTYAIAIIILVLWMSVSMPGQRRALLNINVDWLPVTEAERNMKAPVVDKNSGVEALFWRVHVVDEFFGEDLRRVLYHYVRLKVFDEKGKELASTIDIQFGEKTAILSVAGRTIKADGTELQLKSDSVYERDLIKSRGIRRKVKSFAMPGVEPGAIVEYRWKEVRDDPGSFHMRLQFQREFPVQKSTYFIRPLSRDYTNYTMNIWPFNCAPSSPKLDRDGFNVTALENVPAFREEPMMPGEASIRPWALIAYMLGGRREPDKYWDQIGKEIYNDVLKQGLKADNSIKQAAAKEVAGASEEEDKILHLIRYVRRNMRDLYSSQITDAERAKILKGMPENRIRTSPEVFRSGVGTPNELNVLFAAMASAAGLDARPVLVADRNDIAFNPRMTDQYFLPNIDMAVKVQGQWKLYDVSARLLPSNMLLWNEEGMQALVSDPRKPVFVESPFSPPESSVILRSARFALAEDGTLEGDVDQQYSGHAAFDRRVEMDGETETSRADHEKEEIRKVFPESEVTALRIENADDPEGLLGVHYHIKIPAYALRTGKRFLIQPLFFQRGAQPIFSSTERVNPIEFRYAWMENDTVSIMLPEGYTVDSAEGSGTINFGQPGSHQISMSIRDSRELVCLRKLVFGKGGALYFPMSFYPQIKTAFEKIQQRDGQMISLKSPTEAK
jgi:hypothetical protein